jgi:hypothetical protein
MKVQALPPAQDTSIACSHVASRKVQRPTKEELSQDMQSMSFLAIGRKYGVSDNSIRKWARQYEIL